MIEQVAGGKAVPTDVLDQILARTDGVPLFVEELTKMLLESGLLKDTGDRYELVNPLPLLAIPTTLQDLLMARLDRLAPVKSWRGRSGNRPGIQPRSPGRRDRPRR